MIEWIKYNIYAHEVGMEKKYWIETYKGRKREKYTHTHSQTANKIEEKPEMEKKRERGKRKSGTNG